MLRAKRSRVSLLGIGVLASCGQPAESQESDVDAFRDAVMVAYDNRDVEALAALHALDVSVVNSRGETVEGRAAFAEYWDERWEGTTGPNPLQYSPLEVREAGPYVIERGEYGPRGAAAVGRYIWVLASRPANPGGWEILWFIYSS